LLEKFEDRTLLSLSNPLVLPGDISIDPAVGTQYEPRIARGLNSSLVVWTDNRTSLQNAPIGLTPYTDKLGTLHDIYAARLDSSGTVIDTTPIIISQAQHNQRWPQVAWNGQNWLVAWTTERENNPYESELLAVRVSPAGQILDPTPISFFVGPGSLENHTWSASTDGINWVVVWTGWETGFSGRAINGTRIAPDGTVLDPAGKHLREITQGFIWGADIAFAGDEYLLTWREDVSQYNIRGQLLTPALDKIGSVFTISTAGQYDETRVASDGNNFFVVWAGNSVFSPGRGARVSHRGQVLDPSPLEIANSATSMDVIWDGGNWLTAYSKGLSFAEYDIYASHISSDGTILDPNGFVVKGGSADQTQPAIAPSVDGHGQVVWREMLNQNSVSEPALSDIETANIKLDYSVANHLIVDLSAPRQSVPRMVSNGNGYLAVFQSEISGNSQVLAQRLDAAGNPIDTEPILVATDYARNPSVAWNGSEYLIVWQSPGTALNKQIYARRMLAEGALLDPTAISVMPGMTPDVAAVGNTFLVTSIFRQTAEIQYVTSIRVTGEGQLLGSPQAVGSSFTREQRVVAFGDRWLVVRQRHPTHDNPAAAVYANLVEADGTPGATILVGGGRTPHVAVAGNIAVVAFESGGNIVGVRMKADGALIGTNFTISGASSTQARPAVAWNGTMFVVTWLDHRNEDFPKQWVGDVFAARVSPRGRVLDKDGFAIADSALTEETPTVVGANGYTLFAYAGFNPQAPYAALRITMRTLGGAPVPLPRGHFFATDTAFLGGNRGTLLPSVNERPNQLELARPIATEQEDVLVESSTTTRPAFRFASNQRNGQSDLSWLLSSEEEPY
jgi:hypothetical protein